MSSTPVRRLATILLSSALLVPASGVILAPSPAAADPAATGQSVAEAPTLTGLEVEKKSEPIGIDVDQPRFSWVVDSSARGVVQESYRLRLATTTAGLDDDPVWDSGVVTSPESANVAYTGPALEAATGYVWDVVVVTSVGEAHAGSRFRTGLMDADDWADSAWIGNPRPSADDALTLADARWIWTQEGGTPYAPGDPRAFRTTLPTPSGKTPSSLEVLMTADDSFDLRVDGVAVGATQGAENEWQQSHLYDVDLDGDPDGDGTVVAVRATNGANTPAGLIAHLRMHYTDGTTDDLLTGDTWKAIKSVPADWADPALDDAAWPGAFVQAAYGSGPWGSGVRDPQTPVAPAPLLRKEFDVAGDVAAATVYVAAGGYADVSLNGAPISDDVLSPGFTDYDDTVQYAATDVTEQLTDGANAIGLELGRGFYGMTGSNVWNWQSPPWHDEPVARAVLEIEYADGTTDRVVTDDSWTIHDGPTRFDDLYGGELYDASMVQTGFDTVGFDDTTWPLAPEVRGPKGVLTDMPQQPIRVTEELPAVEITEPTPDTYVVKFPRVLAGWVEFTAQGPAGTTIRGQYGEKLLASGLVNFSNNGGFGSGFQTDRFTLAGTGAPETWEPSFSYKGFQYLQVTGWPGDQPPPLSAFTAKAVHTDAARTGSFESSDATMNATHEAVVDTMLNNIHGIPTDTPMFEKNGWTGDAAVGAEMFLMNLDVGELFAKWLRDLHETRDADGAPMVIAPSSGSWGEWGVAPPWHSAYVNIPWWLYQYGGDDRVMRRQYDGMLAYVDLEFDRSDDGLVVENRLGDWVSPEASPAGGNAPEDTRVSGTAYLYTMLQAMVRTAEHLGKDADAARLTDMAATVKDAFNRTFLDADQGRYRGTGDNGYRQTHNVLAVAFGLTPDAATEQRVVDSIAADVRAKGVHLNTGVLGTKYLLPVLTDHGYADLAYDLAVQRTYPSWGYMIDQGATSMWEHWSADARSRGHYFLGTVDDWFYHSVAGIRPSEQTGYRDVTIAPAVTDDLDWAKATTDTPFGPVTSDWRHVDGDLALDVDVPVGATGHLEIPAASGAAVVEGDVLATDAEGVLDSSYADGRLSLTVGSGHYELRVRADLATIGRVLDRVAEARASAATHHEDGDLADADHTRLDAGLATVAGHVGDAVTALVAADPDATLAALRAALDVARTLREQTAASGIDLPVRGDLLRRLDRVIAALEAALSERLGVAVSVPPVDESVLPGETVEGTVEVTNDGTEPITDLEVALDLGDWTVGTADLTLASLPGGESASLPFTAVVPDDATPGGRDVTATLGYTGEDRYTLSTSSRFATVTSGLEVDDVTIAATGPEQALATVSVTNTGTAPADGRVELGVPDGWPATVPSAPVTVPAGETTVVEVPLLVPRRVVATDHAVTAAFVRDEDSLATGDGTLAVALATPPTDAEGATDHVDFGDAASENAHAIMASPSSGTSNEAGLSRRYANSTVPGAWYSAVFDVPAGEPFVLRMIETFDKATTKEFNLYADGVLVGRYDLTRTQNSVGWMAHQLVVDSPAALAETGDGSVRLKFEFPLDAGGYDPSIADAWVLPATDDDLAPLASVRVTAAPGRNGWHRGAVEAAVTAVDNRDAEAGLEPAIEVGGPGGWAAYTAPLRVSGEGVHRVDYRARDAAGNSTGARSVPVRIDTVAPATTLAVETAAGQGDAATLVLDATDATSGVATTTYRVDGGAWRTLGEDAPTLTGFGAHVVEYLSTDVAGNAEQLHRLAVDLADVDALEALKAPAVTGKTQVGRTLRASSGTWNTGGLGFEYRWLRDGRPIPRATAARHEVRPGDVGKRLSVRVTATKDGLAPVSATSARTGKVAKAGSAVRLKASPQRVRAGRKVRVSVSVTSPVDPGGAVRLRLDGRTVKTVRASASTVRTTVRVRGRGAHRLQAAYGGSGGVAGSTRTVTIRAR